MQHNFLVDLSILLFLVFVYIYFQIILGTSFKYIRMLPHFK